MDEYKAIIAAVAAFITGGGVFKVWEAYRGVRKDKIDEFEKIIKEWQLVLDNVREAERACAERYERLSIQFAEMQDKDKKMQNDITQLSKQVTILKKSA